MLKPVLLVLPRLIPAPLKQRLHRSRLLDRLARRTFGGLMRVGSEVIEIQSGPLAGLRLVASEHTSHAHISGTYELAVTRAVAGLVAPGAVCYDLGASIGYLSLLMAKKARRVYAFEPAPHAAAELQKHAAANGFAHITVVPHPVSESRRLVTFALTDNAYGSSISADPKWPKLQLTTVTLDDFARDHAPPDFVKLDVEGEEGRVLEGARAILRDRPPVICCELHSVEAARHVCAILSAHDYRLTDLAGRPFVVPSHIVTGHEVHLVAQPA